MLRKCAGVFAALILTSFIAHADQVDDFIRRQLERNHIPGAAVAVVKDGKIVKLSGYGVANLDWDNAVAPDTKFQIASSTKPFTGLLLMSLVRDGKIKLDDSVRVYLPNAPESWQKITMLTLATHSSGLKFNFGDKKFKTVDEAVAEAYTFPLEYEPGSESRYGLTDFVVLTKVLEVAGGKSCPELLRERVLEPLGMRDTRFDNQSDEGPARNWDPMKKRSTTYRWNGTAQKAYAFFYPDWTYSAGGLFSSATDMAKLLIAVGDEKALPRDLLAQMWAPMTLTTGKPGAFAVGWTAHKFRGLDVVGHSGGPALSDIAYFPHTKLGVVVLTNQQKLFPMLAESIANFYLPATAKANDPVIEDPAPDTTAKLRSFIVGLAEGKVDETLFSAEAQKGALPAIKEFGPGIVNQLDRLTSIKLIDRRVAGAKTTLLYRVYFGERPMKWRFVLDSEGKISDLEPSSGD